MVMLRDFRFAFRQLVKARAFTAAAIIVLALGIGANTAIFSLMNTLLFQPPHYAKANEIVDSWALPNGWLPVRNTVKGTEPAPMNTRMAVPIASAVSFWLRVGDTRFSFRGFSWPARR